MLGLENTQKKQHKTPVYRGLTLFLGLLLIAPSRIRTYNLRFRRPMLYPIELWVRHFEITAKTPNCQVAQT